MAHYICWGLGDFWTAQETQDHCVTHYSCRGLGDSRPHGGDSAAAHTVVLSAKWAGAKQSLGSEATTTLVIVKSGR